MTVCPVLAVQLGLEHVSFSRSESTLAVRCGASVATTSTEAERYAKGGVFAEAPDGWCHTSPARLPAAQQSRGDIHLGTDGPRSTASLDVRLPSQAPPGSNRPGNLPVKSVWLQALGPAARPTVGIRARSRVPSVVPGFPDYVRQRLTFRLKIA